MAVPFICSLVMAISFRGGSWGRSGGSLQCETPPVLLEQQLRKFPLWSGRRSKRVSTGDLTLSTPIAGGTRLLLVPTPGNSPLLHFKVGFFLLSPSQQRLKGVSSFKGNLQKPANPHNFFFGHRWETPWLWNFFWGVGRGECCLFLFVVRISKLGGESWCRWYLGQGATVLGRALVWKMEQAMKRQGRLGLEQHCPMGAWPCTALSHRGCWFTQSSSASPLGQDLLWSRLKHFSGHSLLQ